MPRRTRPQFRIATLLWMTLVVAAFFAGYRWHTPTSKPVPSTGPAPLTFDFAMPVSPTEDSTVFSFDVGIGR